MRHKIVILDGYALNPGDLDYSPLEEFGELARMNVLGRENILPPLRFSFFCLS